MAGELKQRSRPFTGETRLAGVLNADPQVLEYIVSLNPHEFSRLNNPYMRRLMSPRITLARVAAIANVPVESLLAQLAARTGSDSAVPPAAAAVAQSPAERPDWVPAPATLREAAAGDAGVTRVVNLLPIDQTLDADPMLPVMAAIKALKPGEVCLIRHSWEPQPFYDVWQKMGTIAWFAEQASEAEWWIWVTRTERTAEPAG